MSISLSDRLQALEAALVNLTNQYNKLASDEEINAVREDIFTQIRNAEKDVQTMESQLEILEKLLKDLS